MSDPNDTEDDSEFETVQIEMDDETKEYIQSIADLAKVTFDQVISVILAKQIMDSKSENERE